jgi:two-component system LytT family response regulator
MKALIIEDEPLAQKRLRRLLEEHAEVIEIVGEASNGLEGLGLIKIKNPDVVFLDIEMPVMTGFDMLRELEHPPKVIFTTAYEDYAIKAFEENSIDYLLKPIEKERLAKAIEKLQRLSPDARSQQRLQEAMEAIQPKKEFKAFPVKVGDKTMLIKPEEIAYLEARDKYVFIVTLSNAEYITDFSLTSLEEKLPAPFMRVHRAFIVNTEKIKEIHRALSGSFTMVMTDKNHTNIHTGRSYYEAVKNLTLL